MKLPNAGRAVIDPAMLRDYLLSPAHPLGRFKAPFFVALGYAQDQWPQLESDLWLRTTWWRSGPTCGPPERGERLPSRCSGSAFGRPLSVIVRRPNEAISSMELAGERTQ